MTVEQIKQLYETYSVPILAENEIRAINFELFTRLVNDISQEAFNQGYKLGAEQTSDIMRALL